MATLAVAASRDGEVQTHDLPGRVSASEPEALGSLIEARRAFERRYVKDALTRPGGHRSRAARALGMSRQGLAKLVQRLGLDANDLD